MVFNGAQWHLLVNHFPVIGFALLVPSLLVALKTTSTELKTFILCSTVLIGLSSLGAYWTGEPAEHVVKPLPEISKALIHRHEDAALWAAILGVSTALAALGALIWKRKDEDSLGKTLPVVFLLTLLTAVAMGKTAHEGGLIRHSELRENPADFSPPLTPIEEEGEEWSDSDLQQEESAVGEEGDHDTIPKGMQGGEAEEGDEAERGEEPSASDVAN